MPVMRWLGNIKYVCVSQSAISKHEVVQAELKGTDVAEAPSFPLEAKSGRNVKC